MPRYITRARSGKTTTQSTYDRAQESQQEEFLRLMRRESEKLLNEFRDNLERSMREEISQQMRAATQQLGGVGGTVDAGGFSPDVAGLASFVGRAISIYASRPRYSETSAESERSQQSRTQFRTSRAESVAELSGALALGERNS